MRLTVLGSGSAFSGAGANATYCLDGALLIDCGAPVHVVAPSAGIEVAGIHTVLLTHFHFDHTGQVVMLLGTRALAEDSPPPLRLAGPSGTREYVTRLLQDGYGSQLRGLIERRLGTSTVVLQDGSDTTVEGYRIRARAVVHSTGPSLAYAVTGPDGATVGFSGDSTMCAGLDAVCAMSDLMVVECSGFDGPVPSHLWSGEVLELVARHPTTAFLASHLPERRAVPGTLLAHDGLTLEVNPPGAALPQPPATLERAPA